MLRTRADTWKVKPQRTPPGLGQPEGGRRNAGGIATCASDAGVPVRACRGTRPGGPRRRQLWLFGGGPAPPEPDTPRRRHVSRHRTYVSVSLCHRQRRLADGTPTPASCRRSHLPASGPRFTRSLQRGRGGAARRMRAAAAAREAGRCFHANVAHSLALRPRSLPRRPVLFHVNTHLASPPPWVQDTREFHSVSKWVNPRSSIRLCGP